MPIEGSLREFAVQDIFQLLHLARKTGELVVVREPSNDRGSVTFDSGAVVGAQLDEAPLHPGHLLLTAGKITESDLRRADELRSTQPRLGWRDVFSRLDAATAEEVDRYLKFQVEEIVYEILEWRAGEFSFNERELGDGESVTWIPTESLLMEGARRADELSALPTAIESTSAVPRLAEAAAEGGLLELAPEDWEVLGRVDGASDVKSIAWTLGRSEFEVSKVISKLVNIGLLDVGPLEHTRTKPPHEIKLDEADRFIEEGNFEEARQRIEEVLARHPEEPRAHYLRARTAEASGDLERAAEGYQKTLSVDPLAEEARLHLGLVHLKLGDIVAATREWTAYLKMAPDNADRRRVERAMSAAHELELVLKEFDGAERT